MNGDTLSQISGSWERHIARKERSMGMIGDPIYDLNVRLSAALERIASLEKECTALRNNLMGLAAYCGGIEAIKESVIQ